MELKSDIILHSSTWLKLDQRYKKTFFKTQWEIFKICLSIGILYDRQLDISETDDDNDNDFDENKTESKYGLEIPRNVFNRHSAEMVFFFQTAILTSKCISLSEKDRLYLAFSEEVSEEELDDDDEIILKNGVSEEALSFNKIDFLKRFANYGAEKLLDCLSNNESETMENLMDFLNKSYKKETEELKAMSEVEDLLDDEIQ